MDILTEIIETVDSIMYELESNGFYEQYIFCDPIKLRREFEIQMQRNWEQLDDIHLLDQIIELKSLSDIKKLVYNTLNTMEVSNNKLNVCYLHNTIDRLPNGLKGITIHSSQGKTIEEDYSIWDLGRIEHKELLYTAISRAKKLDQITLITTENDEINYKK